MYTSLNYLSYTGAGHIIRISSKSWFISQIPFKKWNLYNVYIHSTQTDIFQVFISFNFDDYNWQLMKTPNSVSQQSVSWDLLFTTVNPTHLSVVAKIHKTTWSCFNCVNNIYLPVGTKCCFTLRLTTLSFQQLNYRYEQASASLQHHMLQVPRSKFFQGSADFAKYQHVIQTELPEHL